MKRIWTIAAVFVLWNSAGARAEEIAWPHIGQIKPRHAREIQASNWSVGAETMDRDYTIYRNWKEYLGPLGVKKARIQGGWAKTETRAGVYDFAWLDEIIFDMAAQGVEPWMCLCYGNGLYAAGGGVRLGAALPASGEALRAWTLWVRAVVSRYMDVIDEWEIWNEPNLRRANTAQNYADFLLHTAETIKRLQPNARILAMSTAGVDTRSVADVLEIVRRRGKLHLIDQVTYHPYRANPDESYAAVTELRRTVRSFAPRITIRQGENGCPSVRRKTMALRNYDWTETAQAKWALRRLLGDLGRDIESSYFGIMDMKYPDEMNAKGLLKSRADQTVEYAKPAYYAVQNLVAIFDNRLRRMTDFDCKVSTDRSVSAFAYEDTDSGLNLLTVWLDGEIPSDSTAKTKVDITCSAIRLQNPVYVDLRDGRVYAMPAQTINRRDATTVLRAVPLYDSPVVIADQTQVPITHLQQSR